MCIRFLTASLTFVLAACTTTGAQPANTDTNTVADGASVAKIAALYGITLPGPLGLLASIRNLTRPLQEESPAPAPAVVPC